jgi:hypothetical protein
MGGELGFAPVGEPAVGEGVRITISLGDFVGLFSPWTVGIMVDVGPELKTDGWFVVDTLGLLVLAVLGELDPKDGVALGAAVGESVSVGSSVGTAFGTNVADKLGAYVDDMLGIYVGDLLGAFVGLLIGVTVGDATGRTVGFATGE